MGDARAKFRGRLAIAVAGAAMIVPSSARAFCRTTTVGVDPDFTPTKTDCWDEGLPLFWRNACVGYDLQQSASNQVSLNDAEQALATAFSKWTSTSCPTEGSGTSRVAIDVRNLGPVQCDQVQYNKYQGNANVIMFDDGFWPHDDVNNTLALTTVTFDKNTGEIFDADMEINTFQTTLALTDPVPPDGFDFVSIVTHETGHFLGMAHSGDSQATMFAHYQPGTTSLRNLTDDDVAGICSIYHPDGDRGVADGGVVNEGMCDPTPTGGFMSACGSGNVAPKGGCSVNAGTADARDGIGWIFAAIASVVVRRRASV